jgi:hypothetical protein
MAGYTINTYTPFHFGIKRSAKVADRALTGAMRDARESGQFYPCSSNPYFYQDYDGLGIDDGSGNRHMLTEDDCESLCYGCPILKQCYDFAVANEEQHGVWGGIDFSVKTDKLF